MACDCSRAGNGLCLLGILVPCVFRKAILAETANAVAIGSHLYRHPVLDSFALSVREAGNSADSKSACCVNVLNALPQKRCEPLVMYVTARFSLCTQSRLHMVHELAGALQQAKLSIDKSACVY